MHLYGLIIGLSLVIALNYFFRHQTSVPVSKLNFFTLGLLLSSLIGARLYHVIDQWAYYSQNPSQIPATWNGGLAIFGALIAGGIFIYFFSLISKISFLSLLDSLTPILPLCQSIGRLGNFVNHEIPSWWLEAVLNLGLFFLIRKSKHPTAQYLIGYGLIRLFYEFFRNDTWVIGRFKIAQLLSLLFIGSGIIIWYGSRKNQK